MAGATILKGNPRKDISRTTVNEEHAGRKEGKNWDQEPVRTEKHGKNSNLMVSKAEKSKTEWGRELKKLGMKNETKQTETGMTGEKKEETTVTGKVR